MIYVRIELWPHGSQENAELLGEAKITNIGSGTPTRGEYKYLLRGKHGSKGLREGSVSNFPRKRLLAWDLLYRVLRSAFGVRNEQ